MTAKTTKLDTRRNKNQHRNENKSLVKAPVCKEVDFCSSDTGLVARLLSQNSVLDELGIHTNTTFKSLVSYVSTFLQYVDFHVRK